MATHRSAAAIVVVLLAAASALRPAAAAKPAPGQVPRRALSQVSSDWFEKHPTFPTSAQATGWGAPYTGQLPNGGVMESGAVSNGGRDNRAAHIPTFSTAGLRNAAYWGYGPRWGSGWVGRIGGGFGHRHYGYGIGMGGWGGHHHGGGWGGGHWGGGGGHHHG